MLHLEKSSKTKTADKAKVKSLLDSIRSLANKVIEEFGTKAVSGDSYYP